MAAVEYFSQDIPFKIQSPRKTTSWLKQVITEENRELIHLNYIFCSDEYLLEVNRTYLKHDTYTDIITFDNSDVAGLVEGDIFISIDRVTENAKTLQIPFDVELHRVLVHGVLHLIGYSDKSPRQKSIMRKKEDAYLSLRHDLEK
jgi:rRNA maturation RNase YbeY